MTIQRWLSLVLDLLALVVAVTLETLALYVRDGTSQGATGLALLNLVSFAQVLQEGVLAWTAFETSIGVIWRLKNLMEKTPLEDTPPSPDELPPNWPTHGELQMSNVVLSYRYAQFDYRRRSQSEFTANAFEVAHPATRLHLFWKKSHAVSFQVQGWPLRVVLEGMLFCLVRIH